VHPQIAIGDSDPINVRFGPICGLKSHITRVREVPFADIKRRRLMVLEVALSFGFDQEYTA